jgi:hypothetical protein
MSESLRDMLAREAKEAETRADAEERGDAPPTPGQRGRRPAADPAQVYAVRFPASRLAELRQVADELGEPPTTLIRRWVLERSRPAQRPSRRRRRTATCRPIHPPGGVQATVD